MPISLTLDPARRLLIAAAVGSITREELQDFVRTARAGDLRAWPLLFDATEATTEMTSAEVRGLASTVGGIARREGPRGPVIIAAPHEALYGVMRMYQTLCDIEGFAGVHVFRSRADAEHWISQHHDILP
jgi:hypothetical protein